MKRMGRRLPRWLLEVALVLLAMLALEAYLTRDAVSGKAPVFAGTTLQGEPLDLRALQGRPAVVHFWATWCPVCELEQGTIAAIAEDHPLLGVAMQSGTDEEVVDYLGAQGLDYPVINDPRGELARRYGVVGVPTTFVLDAEGKVRFVTRGYTSGPGLRIRLWLARW